MKYRELGKTGLKVSEIGFGGEWLEKHPKEESVALMKEAHKLGINIVDCWMANPLAREIIGEAIKEDRAGWYVQGQIGSVWENGQYAKTRDVSRAKKGFEELMRLMQTDYIDLGVIHYCDNQDDWDELYNGPFMEYVRDLKKQGIIKHIGLSTHSVNIGTQAVNTGEIEMILFSINAAFDTMPVNKDLDDLFEVENYVEANGKNPEREDFYKLCEEKGVGLTVMKPYAGGRLLDKERSPFKVALTPVQCIHYCLTRPAVASVLVGYDTVEHVKAAVAYETATSDEKDYASVIAHAPMLSYSGQCTYCGHCAPCPMEIDIATVNKFADLAKMRDEVPELVKQHYLELNRHASDCIGCQSCESRCPFGVKVAERMPETAKLFGK